MKLLLFLNLALLCVLGILWLSNLIFRHEIVVVRQLEAFPAVITAYSSEESQTDSTPYLTASQKQVQEGFIACPRKYKFGQQVEIAGRTYTCEDRKNIRYESYPEEWFDIWFPSTELALEWGIKNMEIVIK